MPQPGHRPGPPARRSGPAALQAGRGCRRRRTGHRRPRGRTGPPGDRRPDRPQADPPVAGRQPRQHALQRHLAQQLGVGELLVGGNRQLAGAVGGTDPRAAHRHPTPTQGHRTVLVAVPHRTAGRVVAALDAGQDGDILLHEQVQHRKADADRERQQALVDRAGELAKRDGQRLRQHRLGLLNGIRGDGGMRRLRHGGPLLSGVLADARFLPLAGLRRGTATSTSTTPGTTSRRGVGGCHHGRSTVWQPSTTARLRNSSGSWTMSNWRRSRGAAGRPPRAAGASVRPDLPVALAAGPRCGRNTYRQPNAANAARRCTACAARLAGSAVVAALSCPSRIKWSRPAERTLECLAQCRAGDEAEDERRPGIPRRRW